MNILYLLIPVTLGMGLVGLGAFFWSLGSSQFDDLTDAAERVLVDSEHETLPVTDPDDETKETTA